LAHWIDSRKGISRRKYSTIYCTQASKVCNRLARFVGGVDRYGTRFHCDADRKRAGTLPGVSIAHHTTQ
jgi:hypothetical protein